jgi:dipeptidyl aminopeptidase/acylaminoacyl peptidase
LKLIDALIEANRPYDLFILPQKQHDLWNYPAYWEAIRRYLVEHLKVAGRKQ